MSNAASVQSRLISSIAHKQNIYIRILFSILSSFQSLCFGVLNQHKPKVVISASMRVGWKLLADQSFAWVHVGRRAALKNSLNLMRKKVTSHAFFSNETSSIGRNKFVVEDPLFQFEGISLFPLFQKRVLSIVSKDFPVLAGWVDGAYRFLRTQNVNCLVLDEDVSFFPKTLAETANKLDIPSVVIQHGVTGHARGFLPNSASRIAVWGNISKQQLVSWGIPAEKISVTGFPGLDKKQEVGKSLDKESIKHELSISADKKVIFFPANRLRTMNHGLSRVKATKQQGLEFFKSIVIAANNFPDCVLVVKIHPGDKIQNFSQYLQEQGLGGYSNVRIIDEFNLEKLYAISNIVVNHSSTVCLEAMAFDIPVVNVNLFNKIDYIPFGDQGPVYQVKRSGDIETAIARALANPSELSGQRKQFLEDYCGPMDGKSSERIIQLIRELMEVKQQAKKEEINNEYFVNRS